MCGIVGCILKENDKDAAPILFDCISKLEYRGYDSIGLATYDGNIYIKKDKYTFLINHNTFRMEG